MSQKAKTLPKENNLRFHNTQKYRTEFCKILCDAYLAVTSFLNILYWIWVPVFTPCGTCNFSWPSIKYVKGAYWDFWDHFVPLTE